MSDENVMYAEGYERFLQKIIDKHTNIARLVDSNISVVGDLTEYHDIDAIVKSLLRHLLLTRRTYIMDPELGIGLYKYIFEPADAVTKNQIERELRILVQNETRAEVTYTVEFYKNMRGFKVNIFVKYKERQKSVAISFDESLLKTVSESKG